MRWRGLTTTSTLVGQKGQSALRGAAGPSPLEVDGGTPAASFDLTSLELQAATSSCCFRADDGRERAEPGLAEPGRAEPGRNRAENGLLAESLSSSSGVGTP